MDATRLDGMVEHVQYEVVKLIEFVQKGNGWIFLMNPAPGYAKFASESMLEATLVHLRNLYEFLTSGTGNAKRVVAQNYAPTWKLAARDVMSADDQEAMNGRVAHIGVARTSVAEHGAFGWTAFLDRTAPPILRSFRDFLRGLPGDRREQFFRPTHAHQRTDLITAIEALIVEP